MAAAKRSNLLALCRSLPHATFGCKVAEEEFAAITSIEGITPAKYAARYHWVSVIDPKVLPEKEALDLLRGSYGLVKSALSAKLQRAIDGDGQPKATAKAKAKAKAKKKTAR